MGELVMKTYSARWEESGCRCGGSCNEIKRLIINASSGQEVLGFALELVPKSSPREWIFEELDLSKTGFVYDYW